MQINYKIKFTIKFDINGNSFKVMTENNLDSATLHTKQL